MTTTTAKPKTIHACSACGAAFAKWQGRCSECGEWGTVEEELRRAAPDPVRPSPGGANGPVPMTEVEVRSCPRSPTGIAELDRVLGGGIVAGSAVLVAGDPGIGKSTLLLQASGGVAAAGGSVLYVSGEESPAQVRLRAERLGIADPAIRLGGETDLETILGHARALAPDLLVVDSIQTVHRAGVSSAPGSVTQVRECASALTLFAKATGIPVILIGHVTKSGEVAGPRVLAHVVDVVLSFEGDRYHAYRVLRGVKNRFGATEEVGIFEMRAGGLVEIGSPSGLLLGAGATPEPGSAVVPVVEGTRVLLLETQALVGDGPATPPRRRVAGVDPNRLDLLLAVLEKKTGLRLSARDVYVNVVGGVRIADPGSDLGLALAVASSAADRALPKDLVAFGEIGLMGEVRPVSRARARLAEAAKLGFTRALVPPGTDAPSGIRAIEVSRVGEAFRHAGVGVAHSSSEERIRR